VKEKATKTVPGTVTQEGRRPLDGEVLVQYGDTMVLIELYRQSNYKKPYRTYSFPSVSDGYRHFVFLGRECDDKCKRPYYRLTYKVPKAASPSSENIADDVQAEQQDVIKALTAEIEELKKRCDQLEKEKDDIKRYEKHRRNSLFRVISIITEAARDEIYDNYT